MNQTIQWTSVDVSWDSCDIEHAPVFHGFWGGEAYSGGLIVWFARDEADRLVDWQNEHHAQDPEGYADHFSRLDDGGYQGHNDDVPDDSRIPEMDIPDVGTVYLIGEGWTWMRQEDRDEIEEG